jgi:hypothetical protein
VTLGSSNRVVGRAAITFSVACSLVACGGRDAPTGAPPPSGSLGVVAVADARLAIAALCRIAGDDVEGDAARSTFYDHAHETLHVIAAAVELRDRAAAAALYREKAVVEDDLRRPRPPRSFRRDVERLIDATRRALARVGIDAPPCGS